MSGILFLTDQDFFIKEGQNGLILCTQVPGYSLVLFYSNLCPHCKTLDPIFRSLPKHISGCNFAMVNIKTYPKVHTASKKTLCEISYVPTLILYVDGIPFVRCKVEYTVEAIKAFIVKVHEHIKQQTATPASLSNPRTMTTMGRNQFENRYGNDPKQKHKHQAHRSPLTEGIPVFGSNDNVTYLDFIDAYSTPR